MVKKCKSILSQYFKKGAEYSLSNAHDFLGVFDNLFASVIELAWSAQIQRVPCWPKIKIL